ncbi:regulator of Vps4 activity in the MVB pathway-domain-containing protein [Catenaria anguillulae PL171]|uniref:Regulator of Vps4 activity in the MVB pathway-domain-containing protein n=1 Tax=Catenaria anguillulae PL171 TaxID=765915 RepID=A0A1Y2HMK5_9FUNG|nr:regulator of Vps4 activity in the MVB pathway-domain-containing protein [Catenaria anguillulae PL171]
MAPNIPGVFSANRLKVSLRLAVNRLKLLQQKKASLNASQRKELSLLLEHGKVESARVRVEHIIREDLIMEALEVLELYCELLLARFGLIESMSQCDAQLVEAVHTLMYAAPRSEVKELHQVKDLLTLKYGRDFAQSAVENRADAVNRRVIQKLKVQTPERSLVNLYLKEIAKAYNVKWEPEEDDEAPVSPGAGGSGSGGDTTASFLAGAKAKDVRTDPTGSYTAYDASTIGFTPSRDTPLNPAVAPTPSPLPPRTSSAQYITHQVPINPPPQVWQPPHLTQQPISPPPPLQQQPQQQPLAPQYMMPTGASVASSVYYAAAQQSPPMYQQQPTHYMDGTPIPMPMPSPLMPPPSQHLQRQPPTCADTTGLLSAGNNASTAPETASVMGASSMGTLVNIGGNAQVGGDKSKATAAAAAAADGQVPEFPSIPNGPPAASAPAAADKEQGGDNGSGAGAPQEGGDDDPDFDELARRFEALKRKK